MTRFRDIVDSPCGIRYCLDTLELQSGFARRRLLDSAMMTDRESITRTYSRMRDYVSLVDNRKMLVQNVQFKLQGLRDISGTLDSLAQGNVLDDIEFFEVKHLAMLADEIHRLLESSLCIDWTSPDLERVIEILDPDGLRIGTFYIYDSYSMELRNLRRAVEADPDDEQLKDELCNEEDRIKGQLSEMLRPYAQELAGTLAALAAIDLDIAKALQMRKEGLCIPAVGDRAVLKGMFNPEVRAALARCSRSFQPIDFDFAPGVPTTLIGANMGGKTVALKTLCLCQYLMQFGFAVPAAEAVLPVFDNVCFCIGDEQDQQKGLSSFAAEMLRIDRMISTVNGGGRVLALVDEPARTTNPIEGQALVSSLLKLMGGCANLSLVLTTHYKVENAGKCWRVKGLVEGSKGMKMDYALVETQSNEVPHEALNIAAELGISRQWLALAGEMLANKDNNTL